MALIFIPSKLSESIFLSQAHLKSYIESEALERRGRGMEEPAGLAYTRRLLDALLNYQALPGTLHSALDDYKFADGNKESEVSEYLIEHPELNEFLLFLPHKIEEYFGPQAELFLELRLDPEEDYKDLFVVIKTQLNLQESLRLLDRFDDEWFLEELPKIGNALNVTIQSKDEL